MKKLYPLIWILVALLMLVLAPASAQTIPDFQVNENASPDGSEQSEPCISGDGQGNYVVVWKDKRSGVDKEFWAQFYLGDGTARGPNFRIDNSDLEGAKYNPVVAMDQDLGFVVCWLNRDFMNVDIYAQRISSEGALIGDAFRINEDLGQRVERSCPNVSVDDNGNMLFVWADERNGDWDVYAQRYSRDSQALGGNFQVSNDGTGRDQYWVSMTGESNGDAIVSWSDYRAGNHDIYAQRILSDGSMPGSNTLVSNDDSQEMQLWPMVSISGNGAYIIVWQDNRNAPGDIYAQLYSSDDQAIGTNFPVNDTTVEVPLWRPTTASDDAGNFIVGWSDERNGTADVFVQRLTSTGLPIGPLIKASDGPELTTQHSCVAAMADDGRFFMVWEDRRLGNKGDVFAQAFLSDGSPHGDDIKVNDDVGSCDQTESAIAIDDDGNFIILWVDLPGDGKRLCAQRYSVNGTLLGGPIVVTDDVGSTNPGEPDVAFDKEGNFVVAWCDFDYGKTKGCRIYGQRFSNLGLHLGETFQVNTSPRETFGASVACQSNGDFLICWSDDIDDSKGTEPDIYAQNYYADGSTNGPNFMVNDNAGPTAQRCPEIAIDGNGTYIIVWSDDRDTDDYAYFQRIAADGTFLGANQRVGDNLIGHYRASAGVSCDNAGNFVITWIHAQGDQRCVYAQQFDKDAVPVDAVFRVDQGLGEVLAASPIVAVGEDGKFSIAWTGMLADDINIYAQNINSDGSFRGGNYLISNTPAWTQTHPDLQIRNDQLFFTWRDNRGGQTQFDIYAKVLDWDIVLAVDDPGSLLPTAHARLVNNFPNPFNPSTLIQYRVVQTSQVTLDVFNIRGEKVVTLVDRSMAPGLYEVNFNAGGLSSGTYFYKLQTGSDRQTGKMVLLK